MQPGFTGQFGVKRDCDDVALPHGDRVSIDLCEHLDAIAELWRPTALG